MIGIDGRFYVDHRKPYFDGKIKAGLRTVEIKQNRIVTLPDGWDENYSDRAYEVVNDRRRVVFQILLESAEHVSIDAGQWISNDSQWRTNVFKYPSSKYFGQTVDGVNFKPLTVTTLYQFFLTDCKTGYTRTARKFEDRYFVERIICRNWDAKSSYLSVFVPNVVTMTAIRTLATEYRKIMDEEDRAGFSKGTIFTGRVFIYHEGYILEGQKTELEELLKKAGADPVFYGPDEEIRRNSPLYQK